MKVSVLFSGMICIVRDWPKGSEPQEPSERAPHPVTMVGVHGQGTSEVPIHVPHLVMPMQSVGRGSTWEPSRVVQTAQGQLALFDLRGMSLAVDTDQPGRGVSFRDRLRPGHAGSPSVDPNDDGWEDIAWIADYERVLGAPPTWAVDITRPEKYPDTISFVADLNVGRLRPVEPRADRNRESTWRFDPPGDPSFEQGFTDAARWTFTDARPAIVSRSWDSGQSSAIHLAGATVDIAISALSTHPPEGEDPDVLTHFRGYQTLFAPRAGRAQGPVPMRVKDPGVQSGQATIEPFFCLMALVNRVGPS